MHYRSAGVRLVDFGRRQLRVVRSPTLLADVIEAIRGVQTAASEAHATRVMVAMGGEDAKVVAVLHSLAETEGVPSRLRQSVPGRLLMALAAFERTSDEPDSTYFDALLTDPIALAVKLGCLGDLACLNAGDTDEMGARRQLKLLRVTAVKLGTTLPSVLATWDGGRSPYR